MYRHTIKLLLHLAIILSAVNYISGRDLTQEPGHLKPFGEGRPSQLVPEIDGFLTPEEFFTNNVIPLRPIMMKGAAKTFPAFKKWTDEYFLSLDEPQDHKVGIETIKKEDRNQKMLDMSFKDFVKIYNDTTYYMVDAVPEFIRQDVVLPCSLQCKPIVEKTLADNVMWFSSGGTNSVVHTDSFDNLNCLLRGNKTLVMVDPSLYKDKVDIDHPEGSYSGVDVHSVDYLNYPGLADVEFYHVNVTAGDCLYIPYKWFHQVRSYGSNLAVNVWWHHYIKEEIDFSECNKVCDPALTLLEAKFHPMDTDSMPPEEVRDHFLSLISLSKPLDFPRFVGKLVTGMTVTELEQNDELRTGMSSIFTLLDLDKDGIITNEEITDATDETYEEVWGIMTYLESAMYGGEEDGLAGEGMYGADEGDDLDHDDEGYQRYQGDPDYEEDTLDNIYAENGQYFIDDNLFNDGGEAVDLDDDDDNIDDNFGNFVGGQTKEKKLDRKPHDEF